MKSKLFTVGMKDAVRSLLLAVMTALGTGVLEVLNSGAIPDKPSIRKIGIAGAAAGMAYIIKNFFTNSNDQMFKKEDSNAPSAPAS
jgi:hypothetical protein